MPYNKHLRDQIKQAREKAEHCQHTKTHQVGMGIYCDECRWLVRTLTLEEFKEQLAKGLIP